MRGENWAARACTVYVYAYGVLNTELPKPITYYLHVLQFKSEQGVRAAHASHATTLSEVVVVLLRSSSTTT